MSLFPDEPGGLNRYVGELRLAFERAGVEPRTVVVSSSAAQAGAVIVAASPNESLLRRVGRYTAAVQSAARCVDIVDCHFALYGFLPLLLPGLHRLPLVVHFHGPWADESRAAGRSGRGLPARRFIERAVYRKALEVIVLSHAFKRILVERYNVPPWRVHVVRPGVDLEWFTTGDRSEARRKLGLDSEEFVAVSARRLVPRMGIDLLLKAWTAMYEDRCRLLIVGDGPERQRLERSTDELRTGESVRFLGRVSDEVLRDCYRAADVCVVPSVELEGFGLVVTEALACGTPVICTDAGGLPEVVASLDETLVVPAGDVSALANRIRGARDASAPLPPPSECRAFVASSSWDETARRHLEIYSSALAGPANTRTKLRVVYLDHCAKLSGGELALLRLLPALDGVEPHVILAEDGPLVPRLLQAGVSVEVLPLAERARELRRDRVRPLGVPGSSLLHSVVYSFRLARRLRQLRPDLVHTNSLKAALYGGIAARAASIPIVWHIRDRIADDYLPVAAVRLVRLLARHVPDIVVANSTSTLATLPGVRNGTVAASPVEPAPVNGRPYDRRPLRVGIVGRIAPWKGQHVFLEAFARAFPNGDEEAVVIGEPLFGEDVYNGELHELSARLGLKGRVTFTGFRERIPSELAKLDVLVHASVVPEPFGQVVAQGMAAGVPVVAAAAGGPAELIDDGDTGLLYEPGDVDEIAEILTKLARDEALRARLGAAAREKARAFAPDVIADQMMNVYRQVVGGSRR
jgi:glycosyltransferase involved in cell wall biosynthesis